MAIVAGHAHDADNCRRRLLYFAGDCLLCRRLLAAQRTRDGPWMALISAALQQLAENAPRSALVARAMNPAHSSATPVWPPNETSWPSPPNVKISWGWPAIAAARLRAAVGPWRNAEASACERRTSAAVDAPRRRAMGPRSTTVRTRESHASTPPRAAVRVARQPGRNRIEARDPRRFAAVNKITLEV
jgi:hypothetical protein